MSRIKKRVFEILEKGCGGDIFSIFANGILIFFIAATVLCLFLSTFSLGGSFKKISDLIEIGAGAVFSVEYILRLWISPLLFPEKKPFRARIKYAFSFIAIIDFVTVLSFYISAFSNLPPAAIELISLVRVCRLFKLARYSSSFFILIDVIKSRAQELKISIFVIFILMIVSSLFMYEIESKAQPLVFNNAFSSLWWAVATFTTVGYGDIYPITSAGKILGTTIALLGIGLVAVPTGIISSGFMEAQLKSEHGLRRLRNMSKHILICGWRDDFQKILEAMLKDSRAENIVLVNEAPSEKIEALRSIPEFKGIQYVSGDFSDENTLKRAKIEEAERALVVADHSQKLSRLETDSKTVLAVLTMTNLNPSIYIAAELIDSKFKQHLELAHCDEIILANDYERKLLVSASSGIGLSQIITELVSGNGGGIFIEEIPKDFAGKTFGEFKDSLKTDAILIGLLENTGNFHQRRTEALKEAQKTPDIKKIVSNLKKIKELKSNAPVIAPKSSYIIKPYSSAVFVAGNRSEGDSNES